MHHCSDSIPSGVVFIGISISLIGGKGYESANNYAALVFSLIIFYYVYRLFKPALYKMIDAALSPEIVSKIITEANKIEGVIAVDN